MQRPNGSKHKYQVELEIKTFGTDFLLFHIVCLSGSVQLDSPPSYPPPPPARDRVNPFAALVELLTHAQSRVDTKRWLPSTGSGSGVEWGGLCCSG